MPKLRIAVFAAACILLVAGPATASPGVAPASVAPTPTPDPLTSQLDSAVQTQQQLAATKSALSDEIQAAKDEQVQLRALIASNQAQIAQTLKDIAVAEQQYADATAKAAYEAGVAEAAQIQEKQDKILLAESLRDAYSHDGDYLSYILAGASLDQLFTRAAEVSQTTGATRDLVSAVQDDITAAQKAKADAETEADKAEAATEQLSAQRDTLAKQIANAQQLISKLQGQAWAAAQEILAANKQDLALAQQIASLRIDQLDQTIAQAEQADWQAAEYYIQNHLGDFPGFSGTVNISPTSGQHPLIWPVPGSTISQPFGPSPYPFEPPYGGYPHFHTGLDLSGTLGMHVYAAADGIVVAASSSTVGYGNHIIVAHPDGMLTLYGHLEAMLVQPGQQVHQGQLIGLLGSTGNSTGPHCHFEVRINQTPVNPLPFLPALPPGATGPPPA